MRVWLVVLLLAPAAAIIRVTAPQFDVEVEGHQFETGFIVPAQHIDIQTRYGRGHGSFFYRGLRSGTVRSGVSGVPLLGKIGDNIHYAINKDYSQAARRQGIVSIETNGKNPYIKFEFRTEKAQGVFQITVTFLLKDDENSAWLFTTSTRRGYSVALQLGAESDVMENDGVTMAGTMVVRIEKSTTPYNEEYLPRIPGPGEPDQRWGTDRPTTANGRWQAPVKYVPPPPEPVIPAPWFDVRGDDDRYFHDPRFGRPKTAPPKPQPAPRQTRRRGGGPEDVISWTRAFRRPPYSLNDKAAEFAAKLYWNPTIPRSVDDQAHMRWCAKEGMKEWREYVARTNDW